MALEKPRKGLLLASAAAGFALLSGAAFAQTPPESGQDETAAGADDEVFVTGSRIRRSEFTSTSPVEVITTETTQAAGIITTSEALQTSQAALGSGQTGGATSSPASLGGAGVATVSLRGLGPQRTLVLMNGRRLNPAGARGQVVSADLNTIPGSAVQRTEVLMDGASSVYGSDAVAGAVNIITRTDVDGLIIEGSANHPLEGGGDTAAWSATLGNTFERGHFLASFQFTDQQALLAGDRDWAACPQGLSRRATTDPARTTFTDTGISNDPAGVCTVAPYGVVTFGGRATGLFVGNDFDGVALYDPNSLRLRAQRGATLNQVLFGPGSAIINPAFTPGTGIYPTATPIADFAVVAPAAAGRAARNGSTPFDMPRYRETTVISPTQTSNLFVEGAFDIDAFGGAEAFYEAQYSRRESSQFGVGQVSFTGINNPTNPFGRAAQVIFPGFFNTDQTVDAYRLVGGLRGELDSGWNWEVFYQFGNSDARYGADVFLSDRLTDALTMAATTDPTLPAIQVGANRYTCASNLASPRLGPICTPLNLFSADTLLDGAPTATVLTTTGSASVDALDYVMGYDQGTTNYQTKTIGGSFGGDLFEMPAGAVQAVLGFEWRSESIDDQPGAQAQAGNVYQATQAGPTVGSDSVRELFGEIEFPLLRDSPLAEDLSLNLSARWTDYESYGDNVTYKGSVRWDVTSFLGLRATYGTSYRAPALFEQFLGNQYGSLTVTALDPCTAANRATSAVRDANCAADGIPVGFSGPLQSYTTITIGNGRSLDPETSENFTAGVVLSPPLPDGFGDLSLAVDYTEITINDQVASYSPTNIVSFCYSDPAFRSNAEGFCQYVSPRTAGPIYTLTVQSPFFNLNEESYRGVDAHARWSRDVGLGRFTLDANASYTLEDVLQLFGGLSQDKNDTSGEPAFTAQIQARLESGPWTFFLQSQYVGATNFSNEAFSTGNNCNWFTVATRADGGTVNVDPECFTLSTDPIWFQTVSARYDGGSWSLRAGVQNLFDEQPPLISASGGTFPRWGNAAFSSQYLPAYRGRAAFVTLTAEF